MHAPGRISESPRYIKGPGWPPSHSLIQSNSHRATNTTSSLNTLTPATTHTHKVPLPQSPATTNYHTRCPSHSCLSPPLLESLTFLSVKLTILRTLLPKGRFLPLSIPSLPDQTPKPRIWMHPLSSGPELSPADQTDQANVECLDWCYRLFITDYICLQRHWGSSPCL